MTITTFYANPNKSIEENAQEALLLFPFIGVAGSINLILFLNDRPSMCGVIDYSELEALEGLVY